MSNSLLVGAIIGQVVVGLVCDRVGRKTALVGTTLFIIIGAIIGTAAHGAHGSVAGLFWCLTFARGITGIGVGGEYPASSTSASEAANEKMIKQRGPGKWFILCRIIFSDSHFLSFHYGHQFCVELWWSIGRRSFLDRSFCSWGKSSANCMACLFWNWNSSSHHRVLFPDANA